MKKLWHSYFEKPIKKVNNYFSFYYKNKVKNCFFSIDNIAFISLAFICTISIIFSYNIENERLHDIIVALSTAVLSSVLIPLSLNIAKYCREIKTTIEICNSILDFSVLIFNELNTHLAKSGDTTLSDFLNMDSDKLLEKATLKESAKTIILFNLIIAKTNRIKSFDFIRTNDLFDVSVEEYETSVKNNSNLNSNYLNLTKLLRCLKTLFKKEFIFNNFSKKTNKFAKEIKEEYYMYDNEYITKCLENDLLEMDVKK